ncbi:MAG: hypothetical protein ACE5H0_13160 [Bacteroidota bacterium]
MCKNKPEKYGSPVLSVDLGGRISSLWGSSNQVALKPMDAAAPAENAEAKLRPERAETVIKVRFAFSAVAWKTLRVSHIVHRLLLIDTSKRQKARRILGSGFSGGVENAFGLSTGLGHP